jgi:hypothetical protein
VFAQDFKASAPLDLLPRPPRAPAPLRGSAERAVRGCGGCCCSYGQLALLLDSPGDAVTAGALVPLTARVDNASSEAVTVAASLVRVVRLKSLGVLGDNTWQRELAVAQKALKPEGAAGRGAQQAGRWVGNELQVAAAGTATCMDALPVPQDATPSMVGGTQVGRVARQACAQAPACLGLGAAAHWRSAEVDVARLPPPSPKQMPQPRPPHPAAPAPPPAHRCLVRAACLRRRRGLLPLGRARRLPAARVGYGRGPAEARRRAGRAAAKGPGGVDRAGP